MLPVLEGLFTIGVVIGVGYLLARIRLLPDATPEVLSRLVFFVATPALLLQTLADAPIAAVLSSGLAVTALATAVAWVVFVAVSRWWWHRDAGSVLGIALGVTGTRIPDLISGPLGLIAGMAVPGALIAFGLSLRGAPLPGRGGRAADLALVVGIKIVLMPVAAFALARWVFGLDGVPLLAATMTAALPTAQNVFVYAMRYRTAVPLARDVVSTTTVACIPALVAIAALLS